METKLSKVKKAFEAGDFQLALRIAAKFFDLGPHRDAIKMGHEAYSNGRFYAQIGKDPEKLKIEGRNALADRYGFSFPSSEK